MVSDELATVVKAMANGRRLEVIEMLAQGEHSVEALSRMLGMGVTTTSAHLQTLKQAGLVTTRRERTTVFYRLAGDDVAELYLAAKRVGLRRSAKLREAVVSYLGQADVPGQADAARPAPVVDPAAVTPQMTVIDVRPREEFEAGHFPGAVSLPLSELEERFGEIPADAEVVVYCRGEFCRMAREAAAWLREQGVDAKAMDEGVIEWRGTKEVELDAAS
ncbi:rhodanese-related sulfurtransferase/DNA-binding transcriptional ArsR family regulator [Streptosporangium becharense]|uniref:Rhodanese-related sulfurtransferase/DNA-binding transcriptional ArsR family regulator n=1 Tax=Streptosporangium becharense TaxID=1816182 RepID=A0A7W9MKF5_9ACTN|nr:metalloregulator ArsR/SmtB family transcription factor [Streptosporangium becharense]MBB5823676.1 rhodanese-related sulfurtransferase/DNA-binding transcriptional ArsR family regulator [Streptosporangium becharense]